MARVTTVLPAEAHERFLRDGYVVLKQVVPRELVERTIALLEEEGPRGGAPAPDPPLSDLIRECVDGAVFSAVGELMGDEPFELEYPVDDRPKPHQPDCEWKREGAHVDF